MATNPVYVFDFDGVICDSAIETGIAGYKTAQTLWSDFPTAEISPHCLHCFKCLRTQLETGYEAVLVMRLLQQQVSCDKIATQYQAQLTYLLKNEPYTAEEYKQAFSKARENWISTNLDDWLANNPLFGHILKPLQARKEKTWYIATAKQERFASLILERNGIVIDTAAIHGLDRGVRKPQTLKDVSAKHPNERIVFIEDRLATLQEVAATPELENVELQLVDWGYNTEDDRKQAEKNNIRIISAQDFMCDSSQ